MGRAPRASSGVAYNDFNGLYCFYFYYCCAAAVTVLVEIGLNRVGGGVALWVILWLKLYNVAFGVGFRLIC